MWTERYRNEEIVGTWWRPDDPTVLFSGSLMLRDDNHGRLTLRGPERKLSSMRGPLTLFGRVSGAEPLEVSLFDVGMRRGPTHDFAIADNPDVEAEFFTNQVLLGRFALLQDERIVGAARLYLTGLSDWFGPASSGCGSISHALGAGVSMRLVPPDHERPEVGALAEGRPQLEITFEEGATLLEVFEEVQLWQMFITFGLRAASCLDELTLRFLDQTSLVFAGALFTQGRDTTLVGPFTSEHVLFDRLKLGAGLAHALESWRERRGSLEIPLILYSTAAYQSPGYRFAGLLSYLQALEILHRGSFGSVLQSFEKDRRRTLKALRAAIPSDLADDARQNVSQSLSFVGSITLLDRLLNLRSMYSKSLAPLFPDATADMGLLKDVRNFLTHFGERRGIGKAFLWSREMAVLTEKTRLFLEICILGRMGMDDPQIAALLVGFEPYSWRHESHLGAQFDETSLEDW